MSEGAHRAVLAALEATSDEASADALARFCAAPDDAVATRLLHSVITAGLAADGARWTMLARAAEHADSISRLVAHCGERVVAGPTVVTAEHLTDAAADRPDHAAAPAGVAVVIPFRDTTTSRTRLRNVLACLRALADQSLAPHTYRIVVVEADAEPRWADALRPHVDEYVHLPWSGHFNTAGAVNVGVARASADAPLLCILDGDVLVDRDFLRRNAARFTRRGQQAHLPYRDALCLDADSSSRAIRARVLAGHERAEESELRGVKLRRPPGHCVWVRRSLFDRVGGMDERFVGWGGEDLDFVFRLDVVGAVDRFDDPLLHLDHDRPQTQEGGRRFYAGRTLLSWRPIDPIGDPAAPARSADDDLAGLIERHDGAESLR